MKPSAIWKDGPVEIRLGVALETRNGIERDGSWAEIESTNDHLARLTDIGEFDNEPSHGDLDDTGHAPAAGQRGQHRRSRGDRMTALGEDVLKAAAEAVGNEVALVVAGVVGGIDKRTAARPGRSVLDTGSFDIGDLELKFGVKAVLGSGKAVEALLTASGEATVEVTLTLRRRTSEAAVESAS
jgi:hypothetical protein